MKTQTEPKDYTKIEAEFKQRREAVTAWWGKRHDRNRPHYEFVMLNKQFDGHEDKLYKLRGAKHPNFVYTYLKHLANVSLQQDYSARVEPNGGGSDLDGARARESALRGLQRMGDADEVYNAVTLDQLAAGFGYAQPLLTYTDSRGMAMTVKYHHIRNPFDVFPDINASSKTYSDAEFWIVRDKLSKEQWESATGEDISLMRGAMEKETWQYWVREALGEDDTEYEMEAGGSKLQSDLEIEYPNGDWEDLIKRDGDGPFARSIKLSQWKWYRMVDDKVVGDPISWVGEESPITACTGPTVLDDGEIYYQTFTEQVEHTARAISLAMWVLQKRMAKSPYSKWKVAYDAVMQAAVDTYIKSSKDGSPDDVLWYAPFTKDGKPLPPPQEVEPSQVDGSLLNFINQCISYMQRIFGIFDANLGEKSNENSGIAVTRRAQQGAISTFDWRFHQIKFIEKINYVVLDLFPRVMTNAQQLLFIDRDDQAAMQWVNDPTKNNLAFRSTEKYRLVIEVTPNSDTAREEEADTLRDILQTMPMVANNPQVAAIVMKAQKGRYSQQIGNMILQTAQDPQKAQAAQAIKELQGQLGQVTQQLQVEKSNNDAEMLKAKNQHDEEMIALRTNAINAQANYFKATGQYAQVEPTFPPEVAGIDSSTIAAPPPALPFMPQPNPQPPPGNPGIPLIHPLAAKPPAMPVSAPTGPVPGLPQ